ncbi:TPA_asm: M [Medicago alphacytorhabdovirus 1]|nr:TPA_asm: M [Medicago alphacytorhabdovirus 1]
MSETIVSGSEETIMDKLKKAIKPDVKEEGHSSERQPTESWVCVSIYNSVFEVELGGQKPVSAIRTGGLDQKMLELLSSNLKPEQKDWILKVLHFMLSGGRTAKCIDCRTSPYLGPKTKRVSYIFDKHNVFFNPTEISLQKVQIREIAKQSVLDGVTLRASICMDIVPKMFSRERMQKALVENPGWFCGTLD